MPLSRFEHLFKKYLNQSCTLQEKKELMELISQREYEDETRELMDQVWISLKEEVPMDDQSSEIVFNNVMASDSDSLSVRYAKFSTHRRKFWMTGIAASILISISGAAWYITHRDKLSSFDGRNNASLTAQSVPYIKSLCLPDGSTVVMQAGSILDFSRHDNEREVRLSGEAYFDVRKEATPFVVYNGNLRVTVLGTSFNMKEDSTTQTLTIAVTTGKVKVENGKRLLAVLTGGQQLVYNKLMQKSHQDSILTLAPAWIKNGLVFRTKSFGEIAKTLEKRFDTKIIFSSPDLRNCTVTASFDGTESIDRILAIICGTLNDQFIVTGKEVNIYGAGCNP